jgi:hypothetical protein
MTMQIDILYMEECTDWQTAAELVQQVLDDLGMAATIDYWLISSDREATEAYFMGSPTIRVDGQDLFPVHSDIPAGMRLRSYITEEGLLGHPTYSMLYEALASLVE